MAAPQPAQPATPAVFAVGEMVSVKRVKSASWQFARILAAPSDAPDNPEHQGRYQVQVLATDQTYFVRPSAIREFAKPPSRVLVAETTQHYRSAAFTYAHPDDTALEVGCHEGVTTDILHTRCRWVLGIDKSWDPVARARARYPHCRFEQVDGFDTAALRRLSPSGGWDKIYIDIGGIAELPIVMSLVGLYYRSFPKSTLIVKSKFMKALLGNCQVYVPSQELQQRQQKQEQQQTKKERKQLRKQQHQQQQQQCYQRHKQQQQQQQQQRRRQEQDEQQQQQDG